MLLFLLAPKDTTEESSPVVDVTTGQLYYKVMLYIIIMPYNIL